MPTCHLVRRGGPPERAPAISWPRERRSNLLLTSMPSRPNLEVGQEPQSIEEVVLISIYTSVPMLACQCAACRGGPAPPRKSCLHKLRAFWQASVH
jgi:hypothetical protein